jgi:hypothetical protein
MLENKIKTFADFMVVDTLFAGTGWCGDDRNG